MRVCLGGTFDILHVGHEALLKKAFEVGDEVFIGVTSQSMAQEHRERRVQPLDVRMRNLEALLRRHDWKGTVSEITHPWGRSVEPRYEAIVVSPETVPRTEEINQAREVRGLKALSVYTIPYLYGDDGLRISSTRVAKKEIDARGRRRTALRIAVGTQNRLKVQATEDAFRAAFPKLPVRVKGVKADPGVPPQPLEAQTWRGAGTRADAAIRGWKDADYGVGIEAGLVTDPYLGRPVDVQYVVVLDKDGGRSAGHGGGFYYPPHVTRDVLAGKTISQVMGPLAGDPRLGSTTGAIGFLTRGAVDRRELTRQGILMALVPRIRRDLYQE